MGRLYIFVGPDPINAIGNHPGGQLTAAKGLIQYAKENNINLKIIDTLQSSFPIPPIYTRAIKAINRIKGVIEILIKYKIKGVIIFSAEGASFIEKIVISFICNLFSTPSIVFIRSGFFLDQVVSNKFWRLIYFYLLKVPPFIGSQGQQWNDIFESMRINKKRIKLIRNWISPDKILSRDLINKQNYEKVTFLFTGWLVRAKGVLDLIESFKRSEILKNSNLIIAGDGHLMNEIKTTIKKYSLLNISLLGWCKPREINKLLLSSNVFVLPTYSEGFPNSILEALAKGLPVISTPVGGIPDSVINFHNGFLFKSGDVDMLQKRMEWFVLNKDNFSKYSYNSLDMAKRNHNYYNNCKKLFNVFS